MLSCASHPAQIWPAVPLLSDLTFEVPPSVPRVPPGKEFAPICESHGAHIQLHSFTYRRLIIPGSTFSRSPPNLPLRSSVAFVPGRSIERGFLRAFQVTHCGPELSARMALSRYIVSVVCDADEGTAEKILALVAKSGAAPS